MASRMIYGMAKQDNAPKLFTVLYKKTQTPVYATFLVMIFILLFAYALPIATLAKLTSSIILCIFVIIHVALIKIKLTETHKPDTFSVPIIVPIIALCSTLLFLGMQFLLVKH
jgi:amino acid transporter